MVVERRVNQYTTDGERDDAEDHQQRHGAISTQSVLRRPFHRGLSDERNGQDNAGRGFLTGGDWLGLAR
jgi:hypothetical protein